MLENYIEDIIRSRNILSIYPAWIYASLISEGEVIRIDNLFGLYQLGKRLQAINELLKMGEETNSALSALWGIKGDLSYILADKLLPLSAIKKSAEELLVLIRATLSQVEKMRGEFPDNATNVSIHNAINTFQFALSEELRQLPVYVVARKGNLSRDRLIEGASEGYSQKARDLADSFIKREINESGRCIAFGLFTACGFHILRAVEICIKGYILAVNGELPKSRNWGKYIEALEKAEATNNLIDLIKILKTKRNPLMHPQDTLDAEDAMDLFSTCQAIIQFLAKEVFDKNLDVKFKDALTTLPNF